MHFFLKLLLIFSLTYPAFAQNPETNIKKVLFINSYHKGYAWSDAIQKGVEQELSKHKFIQLKTIEMDTKRNTSEVFKQNAGLKVKQYITNYQPDVIIASDDNASRYVVMPYYKNSKIPIVFCGINWDISAYNYPYKNTTGMIEVGLTSKIIKQLKNYAKGNKIGFISGDVITAKKEIKYQQKLLNFTYSKAYFVTTMQQWQQKYLQLQQEVDMIFFNNYAGINDWNTELAQKFVLKHTKIPTGAQYNFVAPFVSFTISKIPEEQGRWSAKASLKILAGTKPSQIKISKNKDGELMFNMKLINKLGFKIPFPLLKIATIIK